MYGTRIQKWPPQGRVTQYSGCQEKTKEAVYQATITKVLGLEL